MEKNLFVTKWNKMIMVLSILTRIITLIIFCAVPVCPTGCSTCTADNTCSACSTGYYQSGSSCLRKFFL